MTWRLAPPQVEAERLVRGFAAGFREALEPTAHGHPGGGWGEDHDERGLVDRGQVEHHLPEQRARAHRHQG